MVRESKRHREQLTGPESGSKAKHPAVQIDTQVPGSQGIHVCLLGSMEPNTSKQVGVPGPAFSTGVVAGQ
jgi:hypothetical protein